MGGGPQQCGEYRKSLITVDLKLVLSIPVGRLVTGESLGQGCVFTVRLSNVCVCVGGASGICDCYHVE